MTTSYGYYSPESGKTSELLTSYNNTISASDYAAKNINFTYSYDNNGNITEVRQNGTLTNKYYYDEAGQVIREDWAQQEKTITYSYDNGGNIVSKNEYAYTNSDVLGETVASNTFSYSNYSWKDQLTSVNGEQITYDALGNPVSHGDYITYKWNGRQLLEYKNSNPDDYIRCVYTYGADGLRTRKLVYTYKSSTDATEYLLKQYDYVWKDGILDSEKYVSFDENGAVYKTVIYKYLYDEYNSPIGIALWVDGEKNGNYWYIKNAQGDVTAVYCEGTGIVVNYHYDAYGNMKAVAGEKGTLGAIVMILYNSITYRGYYFDIDTNLYYLQSRYYSPTWGRFLNADDVEYLGVSGTALSYNLYAYCENDSINYIDYDAFWAKDVHSGYGNKSKLNGKKYGTYSWAIEYKMSKSVAKFLAEECNAVDDPNGGLGPLPVGGDQSWHFNVNEGTKKEDSRIINSRNAIKKAREHFEKAESTKSKEKKKQETQEGLRWLARALHARQDMYAHTKKVSYCLVFIVRRGMTYVDVKVWLHLRKYKGVSVDSASAHKDIVTGKVRDCTVAIINDIISDYPYLKSISV